MSRLYLLTLLLTLFAAPLRAETDEAVTTVSLLTCSPGQEVYALYGHTALRVRGSRNMPFGDAVYNYGVFDFNTSFFAWRFALGQTDYIVAPIDYAHFMAEYANRGSSVTEQVLNLTADEARHLADTLWYNSQPENRTYRYNYFSNNCTTRARDMIEASVLGAVVYPVHRPRYTYRQLVHRYTAGHPWASEANDLLLGADADTLITPRDEMFLPASLMDYADSAMIVTPQGAFRPLVRERHTLLPANPDAQRREADAQPAFPLTPRTLGLTLLVMACGLGLWELRRGRVCWQADAAVLTVQGLMGLLIAFMTLCSTHPTVGSNWQVWVFNPLPLVALRSVVGADRRGQRSIYHSLALPWMLVFVVLSLTALRQDFGQLFYPLTLIFISRSVVQLVVTRRH